MLWFNHPKPFSRKEVAVQMVSRKAKPPPDNRTITVDTPAADIPALHALSAGEGAQALRFTMSYTRREYLGILKEHVDYLRAQKKLTSTRRSWVPASLAMAGLLASAAGVAMAADLVSLALFAGAAALTVLISAILGLPVMVGPWIALLGTPVYLMKRARMPVCHFTIDADRIERVTAVEIYSKSWDAITGVRNYALGYLLLSPEGGLPIPHRCLDGEQAALMRALVARHRERLAQGNGRAS
jgi:hypothetical protein